MRAELNNQVTCLVKDERVELIFKEKELMQKEADRQCNWDLQKI